MLFIKIVIPSITFQLQNTIKMCDFGAMAYAYNRIPWQVEAVGSEIESHPRCDG